MLFALFRKKSKNELIFRGKCCIIRVNSNILIAKRLEMIVVKSCKEIASEWEVPVRTVNDWCKKGKILGAVKVGRDWQIPDDAERPADGRVSSGKYAKKKDVGTKPLPIGISDYVRAQDEYYYVDKTLLIKEFLDQKPLVSLFTRPRRFGKTLNMDMLRVFLRFLMRIRANTSLTKQSGNVEKSIVSTRENIRLSF